MLIIIIPNTYSQEVYKATHVKFCDLNQNNQKICLEYFPITDEAIYITKYSDKIVLDSKLEFLGQTYNTSEDYTEDFFDKEFKSTLTKYVIINEYDDIVIYFSKYPIKSIQNHYLCIIKEDDSFTIYLLTKL